MIMKARKLLTGESGIRIILTRLSANGTVTSKKKFPDSLTLSNYSYL